MAALRLRDAQRLYETFNQIKAFVTAGDWNSAAAGASRTRDEAQYQKSVASTNEHQWRDFIVHVDCLDLTIRAQDREGCVGELALLRWALTAIAGP
jgi:hypothetical protein